MFFAIILSVLMTAMVLFVIYLTAQNNEANRDNKRLRGTIDEMKKQIAGYRQREHNDDVQAAYRRGMYVARQTDTLYRQMLDQFERGEQSTVMMHGTKNGGVQ